MLDPRWPLDTSPRCIHAPWGWTYGQWLGCYGLVCVMRSTPRFEGGAHDMQYVLILEVERRMRRTLLSFVSVGFSHSDFRLPVCFPGLFLTWSACRNSDTFTSGMVLRDSFLTVNSGFRFAFQASSWPGALAGISLFGHNYQLYGITWQSLVTPTLIPGTNDMTYRGINLVLFDGSFIHRSQEEADTRNVRWDVPCKILSLWQFFLRCFGPWWFIIWLCSELFSVILTFSVKFSAYTLLLLVEFSLLYYALGHFICTKPQYPYFTIVCILHALFSDLCCPLVTYLIYSPFLITVTFRYCFYCL